MEIIEIAEICYECKYGGFGVDDRCDLGKDQTDSECPFFKPTEGYQDFETLERLRKEVN